jgi:hypothetical protein
VGTLPSAFIRLYPLLQPSAPAWKNRPLLAIILHQSGFGLKEHRFGDRPAIAFEPVFSLKIEPLVDRPAVVAASPRTAVPPPPQALSLHHKKVRGGDIRPGGLKDEMR